MSKIVEVVPYNPNWPSMFEQEAQKIKAVLGGNCIDIHHIGSTSVPGLAAKPIIDMMPVVKDITMVDLKNKEIEALGYVVRGELGMMFRRYFHKGETHSTNHVQLGTISQRYFYKGDAPRTHHVHMWEEGSSEIQKHLLFRDYLIANPAEAKQYQDLKYKLAEQYKYERNAYTMSKDDFIKELNTKAGYEGISAVQALTEMEWSNYHRIREKKVIEEENHYHIVLLKGSTVIGALHIEFLNNAQAKIHFLGIDQPYQSQGYEEELLKIAQKWINQQGKILIYD